MFMTAAQARTTTEDLNNEAAVELRAKIASTIDTAVRKNAFEAFHYDFTGVPITVREAVYKELRDLGYVVTVYSCPLDGYSITISWK